MPASKSKPSMVFLSHASEDKSVVRNLYERLGKENFDPWLDERGLEPGDDWNEVISNKVKSADKVIVCLSESIKKDGFVQKEIEIALHEARTIRPQVNFIIPVCLEQCEIPKSLKHLHKVDLFSDGGFERLMLALNRAEQNPIRRSRGIRVQKAEKRRLAKRPAETLWYTGKRFLRTLRLKEPEPFTPDLAIDCGTANTLICAKGQGIVLNEPSIVLINRANGRVEYAGKQAADGQSRLARDYEASKPVRGGMVADADIAGAMLQHFISKVSKQYGLKNPRGLLLVPANLEETYLKGFIDAAAHAKADMLPFNRVYCAAIGVGLPVNEYAAGLVVSIGAGITEIALILLGFTHYRRLRLGGEDMDNAIIDYVRRKYHLQLTLSKAEELKIKIGSACPLDNELTSNITGKNVVTGLPNTVSVTDEDIREAINDCIYSIIEEIYLVCERGQFDYDLRENGLVLTGGGALLRNIATRLSSVLGIPVSLDQNPKTSAVRGASTILDDGFVCSSLVQSIRRS